MFSYAGNQKEFTPLGTPEVLSFDEFVVLLNAIMTQAPECTECTRIRKPVNLTPCGLIGFPINALLDWPMATPAGYTFFSNALVNQQIQEDPHLLVSFLESQDSRWCPKVTDKTVNLLLKYWVVKSYCAT